MAVNRVRRCFAALSMTSLMQVLAIERRAEGGQPLKINLKNPIDSVTMLCYYNCVTMLREGSGVYGTGTDI